MKVFTILKEARAKDERDKTFYHVGKALAAYVIDDIHHRIDSKKVPHSHKLAMYAVVANNPESMVDLKPAVRSIPKKHINSFLQGFFEVFNGVFMKPFGHVMKHFHETGRLEGGTINANKEHPKDKEIWEKKVSNHIKKGTDKVFKEIEKEYGEISEEKKKHRVKRWKHLVRAHFRDIEKI